MIRTMVADRSIPTFSPAGSGPRRWFILLLAVSVILHVSLAAFLFYSDVISPFSSLEIVNKPYKPYEYVKLAPLPPPRRMSAPVAGQTESLEEIKERERREREKAEREKAEREKAEKEKAEKEKKAEEEKAKEADKEPASTDFGQINQQPIEDIVGRVYEQYKGGKLDLPVMNFTIMAGFEIERDGSLSQMKIIKKSGSAVIDQQALEILYAISESHALSPIHDLTSNTIELELNDSMARLTITGFAPTADEAKTKAGALNLILWGAQLAQKSKNADAAELLSLLKVSSVNKRIDAVMKVSRARATEMMRARFSNPTQ